MIIIESSPKSMDREVGKVTFGTPFEYNGDKYMLCSHYGANGIPKPADGFVYAADLRTGTLIKISSSTSVILLEGEVKLKRMIE